MKKISKRKNNYLLEMNSYKSFMENATIEGKRLKELWDEVSFAGFMYCGERI